MRHVGLRLLGMSLYRIPSYRPWVLILDRSPICSGSTFMSVRNLSLRRDLGHSSRSLKAAALPFRGADETP
jgi:hypothetical protein